MSVLINNAPRLICLNGSPARGGFRLGPMDKLDLDEKNVAGETAFDVLSKDAQAQIVRGLIAKGDLIDPDDVFGVEPEKGKRSRAKANPLRPAVSSRETKPKRPPAAPPAQPELGAPAAPAATDDPPKEG